MDLRDTWEQLDTRHLYKMMIKIRLCLSVKGTAVEAGSVCGMDNILLEKRVLLWQLDIWEGVDKPEMVWRKATRTA